MGKVESCESRPDLVGRRVCGDINVACNSNTCGVCALDETGETERVERRKRNHCPRRTVMGILGRSGCFCEWMVLPTRNLHVVPDGVTDEEACFAYINSFIYLHSIPFCFVLFSLSLASTSY